VPYLYEVILFADKAKNADIALAMAAIFNAVGEQKNQRNSQVISSQSLT